MGFVSNYARNLVAVALGRQPLRPLLFSYYITHRCTLNCRYCCDGDGKRFKEDPIAELSTADAKRLLAILRRAADTLDITGGEPIVREDLEEILAEARRLGLRTVLNTKGAGLQRREGLLRLADTIALSVDTLDPDVLAALIGRPRAQADEIIEAFHFLLERRKRDGFRLVLSAVATPGNLEDVRGVLHIALEHGLGFHLSPEIAGTQANRALREDARYHALLDEVRRAKRERHGVLGIDAYLKGIGTFEPFPCHPLLMPVIRPDGRMYYPCLESKQAEVSVLEAGDYAAALAQARARRGEVPRCGACCHIFCHMALSLLQRHPWAALHESRHWRHL
ncbi:MAG: radical SAM protein [Planctomycetota bacterium]|nr:radical SAM protein [Planctomycetota bacterium]